MTKQAKFKKGDRVLRTKVINGEVRLAISYLVADVYEGVVTLTSEFSDNCNFTFSAYTGNQLTLNGSNTDHKIAIV